MIALLIFYWNFDVPDHLIDRTKTPTHRSLRKDCLLTAEVFSHVFFPPQQIENLFRAVQLEYVL